MHRQRDGSTGTKRIVAIGRQFDTVFERFLGLQDTSKLVEWYSSRLKYRPRRLSGHDERAASLGELPGPQALPFRPVAAPAFCKATEQVAGLIGLVKWQTDP